MEGEQGDKLEIPRSRAGNRPHTQNCIAGLFNSKPWKVMAHCWVADALSQWEGLTYGSQRQQVTAGCWPVGHDCRASGRTGTSLMSTGAWWAEDTLVSKWLGRKVIQCPEQTAVTVDSVFPPRVSGNSSEAALSARTPECRVTTVQVSSVHHLHHNRGEGGWQGFPGALAGGGRAL